MIFKGFTIPDTYTYVRIHTHLLENKYNILGVSELHRKKINRLLMSEYGVCSFSDPLFQTKPGINSRQINPLPAAPLVFKISGAWN